MPRPRRGCPRPVGPLRATGHRAIHAPKSLAAGRQTVRGPAAPSSLARPPRRTRFPVRLGGSALFSVAAAGLSAGAGAEILLPCLVLGAFLCPRPPLPDLHPAFFRPSIMERA